MRTGDWIIHDSGEWSGVFEGFPFALVVADQHRRLVASNPRGRELLRGRGATCCELICARAPREALGGACLTDVALRGVTSPQEVRIDLTSDSGKTVATWVAAFKVRERPPLVIFQLRPGAASDRRRVSTVDFFDLPALRITTLGRLEVTSPEGPLVGPWINNRPGTLLRYLVTERLRSVSTDQIAEALSVSPARVESASAVRQTVYQLRAHLEPNRPPRAPSAYLVTRKGGYALEGVWIDADEFEHRVKLGKRAFRRGNEEAAREWMLQGRALYRGDFLADELAAEWAERERDRLRSLAAQMLRILVQVELRRSDVEAAAVHARDLAEMEPLDADVQREMLRICLMLDRHSEAVRRLDVFRSRLQRHFDQEPNFTLAEVARETASRP